MSYGTHPASSDWETVNVTTIHRAVPGAGELAAINTSALTIWTPPQPGYIIGFTVNDDSADPLVSGGGATTLSFGTAIDGVLILAATAHASLQGTVLQGWGIQGPKNSTNVGTQESGIVVAPAGSVPGRATMMRAVTVLCNAGTYVGTLRFRFEFRPFAGAWA